MIMLNIYAGWIGMLAGALAGAAMGLFFHREQWLGGYGSWRRRMLRLGHIALFGIALINLAFALTAKVLGIERGVEVSSILLLVAAAGMPAVCFLSAIKRGFRHLFVIPASSVIVAVALFTWRIFTL